MILEYMLDDGGFPPQFAYYDDAGMDLFIPKDLILYPDERYTVDLKIHFFIPSGFYLAIVPKSGLASKKGIMIVNSPGTVDSGFTDSVKAILFNSGDERVEFKRGDKICQGIVRKLERVELVEVFAKPITERGDNGIGSSGR